MTCQLVFTFAIVLLELSLFPATTNLSYLAEQLGSYALSQSFPLRFGISVTRLSFTLSLAIMLILTAFVTAAIAAPTNHGLQRRTDAPFGIKKGLAYNDGSQVHTLSRTGSATWAYNWGSEPNAPGFQQIPMVWGPGKGNADLIFAQIHKGDTPWILTYNEPDELLAHGGCQASPQEAHTSWGDDFFRFHDLGVKLVCPAISSWDTRNGHTGGPAGFTWLEQFIGLGASPKQFRCDAQAIHWYGEAGRDGRYQARLFIDYVAHAHEVVNDIFQEDMDLWVTEFSPLPVGDAGVMAAFLDIVVPWLDRQDYVTRYSPFKAELLIDGKKLNEAGKSFVHKEGLT